MDPFPSYRYYEYNQLLRLNRILALKNLGFSLQDINRLLGDALTPDQMRGPLWTELGEYLTRQNVKLPDSPCLTLYYDEEFKERDWDIEVCLPVDTELPPSERVKVYALPAVDAMACTLHHGPFTTIGEAYQAIGQWVDANGYRICGPAREVYLRVADQSSLGASQTDPEPVT